MARPTLGDSETVRLQLKITEEEIRQIDYWRFSRHVSSRSEAVRQLVKIGVMFDEYRLEFADAVKEHDQKLMSLLGAIENEMRASDRYKDIISSEKSVQLDDAGRALVKAYAEAMMDRVRFLMAVSALMRPINIVRGEDGLSQEAERDAKDTSEFFRGMVSLIDERSRKD